MTSALPDSEQEKVRALPANIEEAYRQQCRFYSSDRLRGVVRAYVESLNAVRVRGGGGVYFVHSAHGEALRSLRDLVRQFGSGSLLTRIPLLDQEEEREMVVTAFTTKTQEDLQRLSQDIATARREGHSEKKVLALFRRFQELQAVTVEHSILLSTSIDDAEAAFALAGKQIAQLLSACPLHHRPSWDGAPRAFSAGPERRLSGWRL